MRIKELSKATEIAQSDVALDTEDISSFDGFALKDFQPIVCTILQLAALIRWQCEDFNGGFDQENLNEIARCGKRRFLIVGRS